MLPNVKSYAPGIQKCSLYKNRNCIIRNTAPDFQMLLLKHNLLLLKHGFSDLNLGSMLPRFRFCSRSKNEAKTFGTRHFCIVAPVLESILKGRFEWKGLSLLVLD